MSRTEGTTITVATTVAAPLDEVWRAWTTPADIIQWNAASEDWHTPRASVDLRPGGKFLSRMESKDGRMGFDFEGVFTRVEAHRLIEYAMSDSRKVLVTFADGPNGVSVTETFDSEPTHSLDQQRAGWQSILENFRRHVEGKVRSG